MVEVAPNFVDAMTFDEEPSKPEPSSPKPQQHHRSKQHQNSHLMKMKFWRDAMQNCMSNTSITKKIQYIAEIYESM